MSITIDHLALAFKPTAPSNNAPSLANNTIAPTIPAAPVNHAPVANAGVNQTVNENATVTLNGLGSDSDGDQLTYSWKQMSGPAVILRGESTTNPTFTAPQISSDSTLKFALILTDDKGASSMPTIVSVIVKAVNNHPMVNAGINQTVDPGHVVSLDGTSSKDPDNDPIIYSWTQTGGPPVKLKDANTVMATFTAPSNISADMDLTFKLSVTDSKNATSSENAKVTVNYIPPPNKPPIASAGVAQSVNPGDAVTLEGTASSDPDNDPLEYSWTQTGGPAVALDKADTATPSFTAPDDISADTTLLFSLIVTDNNGAASNPESVDVTVEDPPKPLLPTIPSADTLKHFDTELSGKEEVPPTDSQATGTANLEYVRSKVTSASADSTGSASASASSLRLDYSITALNLLDATAGHIHMGKQGENGPIVVKLFKYDTPMNEVSVNGTITADELEGPLADKQLSDLITAMNDGETYLNIHTEQYPIGEIRGQIIPLINIDVEKIMGDQVQQLNSSKPSGAISELMEQLFGEK